MSSREAILGRVRTALADVPRSTPEADVPLSWGYGAPTIPETGFDLLDLFVERVEDYRAVVERCGPGEVAGRIAAALGGVGSVVLPSGVPDAWRDAVGAVVEQQVHHLSFPPWAGARASALRIA